MIKISGYRPFEGDDVLELVGDLIDFNAINTFLDQSPYKQRLAAYYIQSLASAKLWPVQDAEARMMVKKALDKLNALMCDKKYIVEWQCEQAIRRELAIQIKYLETLKDKAEDPDYAKNMVYNLGKEKLK